MPIVQVVHNSAILIQSVLSWSLFVFRAMLCIYIVVCFIFACYVLKKCKKSVDTVLMIVTTTPFCCSLASLVEDCHLFLLSISRAAMCCTISVFWSGNCTSQEDFAVYFCQINLSLSTVLNGFHTKILNFVSKYAQQMWKLVADISFCGLASLHTVRSII